MKFQVAGDRTVLAPSQKSRSEDGGERYAGGDAAEPSPPIPSVRTGPGAGAATSYGAKRRDEIGRGLDPKPGPRAGFETRILYLIVLAFGRSALCGARRIETQRRA